MPAARVDRRQGSLRIMTDRPDVAIVDYGMGNLFSVEAACAHAGMQAAITSDARRVERADAAILPGVGAFPEAMRRLRDARLDEALRALAARRRPLLAICLGMQLLFDTSEEFGPSGGLGLLRGEVVGLRRRVVSGKVPAIGWNSVRSSGRCAVEWLRSPVAGLRDDEQFYFVHSYYVRPADPALVITWSSYGGVEYASSLGAGSIFACQFHPERSGPAGLRIYRNLAAAVRSPS